jgi:hypothetical protein
LLRVRDAGATSATALAAPPGFAGIEGLGARAFDTAGARAAAGIVARVAPGLGDGAEPAGGDGVGAWARRQLACPRAVLAAFGLGPAWPRRAPRADARLEGPCRVR